MTDDLRAPYRIAFDNARDPYTARNALGIATTDLSLYAPLASPTFTGDPTAPTPATGDNDTSIATTAFVKAQGYALGTDFPAGAWTTWTPTISSSTGTITTITLVRARYTRMGKTIVAQLDVVINNAGTGGGALQFTLPVNAVLPPFHGCIFGREWNATGAMLQGAVTTATLGYVLKYDGSGIVATNVACGVTAVYEAA